LNKSIFKRLFSKCAYYVRDKSWKHSIIWKEESAKMRVHFSSNHSFCFNSLCGYVESFGLCPFLTTHSPSSEWKLHTKKRETLWVTHMDNFSHLLFAQNKCSWVFSSSVKLLTIYLFYFFFHSLASDVVVIVVTIECVNNNLRSRPTWNAVIGVVCFCNFQTHT
jgi:hypothetical protein